MAALGLAQDPSSSPKAPEKASEPRWGLDLTSYRPTQSAVRDRFGENWTFLSLAQGSVVKRQGTYVNWDVDAFITSQGENRPEKAFLGVFGIHLTQSPFHEDYCGLRPFFGAGVNLVYQDVTSRSLDFSVKKLGFGGNVFIGSNVSKSAVVQLKYQWISEVHGVDFSGISLNVGIRF